VIKVAISGSHGVGKTYIVDKVGTLADESGWIVRNVVSPTRYIKSLGFGNNHQLTFDTELLCQAIRVVREKECEKGLKTIEDFNHLKGEKKPTLVLGDRCLLDELSYTAEAILRLSSEGSGEQLKDLEAYYPLSYKFSYRNVERFWDRVYYKPSHPGFPPQEDDDRLSSLKYQKDVDTQVAYHWGQLPFPQRQMTLTDRDDAVEHIWKDIQAMMEESHA
jgi:hypothetical protein